MTSIDHGPREVATLAGGCFWCLEAVFDQLKGVLSVQSGYMGGHARAPTYEEVCSGETGHAEVVRIAFDPDTLSYRELLEVFFPIHDPTTPDRQGNDVGTQYRSAVFCHSPEQQAIAQEVRSGAPDAAASGPGRGTAASAGLAQASAPSSPRTAPALRMPARATPPAAAPRAARARGASGPAAPPPPARRPRRGSPRRPPRRRTGPRRRGTTARAPIPRTRRTA